MAFRTGNPTLGDSTFDFSVASSGAERMTLQGTVNKAIVLLGIALLTASVPWTQYDSGGAALPLAIYLGVGSLGGLVAAVVASFRPPWSPVLAPIYAGFEGLALGAVSSLIERRFPGVVIQAVGLTFGVLFALLLAYRSGAIRASENFKLGVVAATGGVLLVYLVSLFARLFGHPIPYIHDAGPVGIGFSLIVVAIAAANLVLDFDFIESGALRGAPRYMEWYGAFGLMVTLFWLYLELLRLLAKIRSR